MSIEKSSARALRRLREESPAEFKRIMRAVTASPEGATERADRLERENLQLREALRPFSDYAERLERNASSRKLGDSTPVTVSPEIPPDKPADARLGDLRRARRVLWGGEKVGQPKGANDINDIARQAWDAALEEAEALVHRMRQRWAMARGFEGHTAAANIIGQEIAALYAKAREEG